MVYMESFDEKPPFVLYPSYGVDETLSSPMLWLNIY